MWDPFAVGAPHGEGATGHPWGPPAAMGHPGKGRDPGTPPPLTPSPHPRRGGRGAGAGVRGGDAGCGRAGPAGRAHLGALAPPRALQGGAGGGRRPPPRAVRAPRGGALQGGRHLRRAPCPRQPLHGGGCAAPRPLQGELVVCLVHAPCSCACCTLLGCVLLPCTCLLHAPCSCSLVVCSFLACSSCCVPLLHVPSLLMLVARSQLTPASSHTQCAPCLHTLVARFFLAHICCMSLAHVLLLCTSLHTLGARSLLALSYPPSWLMALRAAHPRSLHTPCSC